MTDQLKNNDPPDCAYFSPEDPRWEGVKKTPPPSQPLPTLSKVPDIHHLALYQFPGAFAEWQRTLELALENGDGIDTGEIPPDLCAAFDAMQLTLTEKLDSAVKQVRTWEIQANAARGEIKALALLLANLNHFAAVRDLRVLTMKRLIMLALDSAKMRSWEGETWKLWIQKSPAPSLQFVGNVDELPMELVKFTKHPDKDAAQKMVDETGEIPQGFELPEQGRHLRIK